MLPTRELLLGASYPNSLAAVLDLAAISLRTYQPQWSGFLTAPEQEECLNRLNQLIELTVISNGGFPQAERRRLRLERSENSTSDPASNQQTPQELREQMPPAEQFKLLEISGNFLFDPAEAIDFRQALQADGLGVAEFGDVLDSYLTVRLVLCNSQRLNGIHSDELLARTWLVRNRKVFVDYF